MMGTAQVRERDEENVSAEVSHGRPTTYPGMAGILPLPVSLVHVVHGSKSAIEFLCLGFLWFNITNGTFLWCLNLIQSQKLFRVWDCVGLSWFLFPCFPHCLSSFHCPVQRGCIVQLWDCTLMRIHTSSPGIPGEMYSISQEHDCLVPCWQFHTNSSAPLSDMGGCPIYSCNRVLERVRCLLLVLSLSEILLTLMICGFCPQTMDMELHRRSVGKKDK